LNDVEGQPAILLVGQDVTEHKRAVERLVQSERLAAIGEAMTGLAHESRNALQRSQAYLELLASQVENDPESVDLVGKIQVAQNQLHQLYEEVRQYAAPLRINPTSCDLVELIDETWAHLEQGRRGRKVQFIWDGSPPEVTCSVDRMMIQQVFRNALENSLAACGDPVEIQVSCRRLQQAGHGSVEIRMRDNGPGLSAEQRARIFEPFFTTKQRGTGLGMTLAQRIVEAHGGTISALSENGGGTQIVIQLPATSGEA
jgi:signal transduction histidine kinase